MLVRRIKYTVFLTVGILLVGCSTIDIEEYPNHPLESLKFFGATSNLQIAATPMSDKSDMKKYFGVDLIERGIFPMYIAVKNVSNNSIYIVKEDAFQLHQGDLKSDSSLNSLDIANSSKAINVAGATMLSVPLMLLGGKLQSDEDVTEHNFEKKRFATDTLRTGEEAFGFVYFPIPEDTSSDKWTLYLQAKEIKQGRIDRVSLTFFVDKN